MNHPLTDKICHKIIDSKDCSKYRAEYTHYFVEDYMRDAADWQLEQVIKWLYDNLYWVEEDGSLRYLSGEMVSIDHHQIIDDLKEAMRPQENG